MTSFRFLHAADIHLDSPLKGLAGQEGNTAHRIRAATREAFDRLVDVAIEESVDFLIIAGDLYDGDWRDYKTGLFFAAQMGKLKSRGIPIYLLHGNHDAESQITKRLELPDNVNIFDSKKPETFELKELSVALHGQSFRQRDVSDNLSLAYPAPLPGKFNIGVLHTGLGGMGGHVNYAPCSLGDLVNKGYAYWALGHVHQAHVLHEHPHVVFPGNLQGRHAREIGPKGATLVTVTDGQIVNVHPVHCDVVRWTVLTLDLGEANNLGEVTDLIREALEKAVSNDAEGRLLVCRIILTGITGLQQQLLASTEKINAEAQASALGLGDEVAWVESVVISTSAAADRQVGAEHDDAINDLEKLLGTASADPDILAQVEAEIGELVRRLPHEVRTEIEDRILNYAVRGDYTALIAEVAPYLSARLSTQVDVP